MNKNQLKNLKAVLRSIELNSVVFSDIAQSIEKEQFLLEDSLSPARHWSSRPGDADERVKSLTEELEALQSIQESFDNLISALRNRLGEVETDQHKNELQLLQKIAKFKNQVQTGRDPLFEEAARLVVTSHTTSTASLQRRYSIGYNRAGIIMDQLEEAGIVGPAKGGNPRPVLVDATTLETILKDD